VISTLSVAITTLIAQVAAFPLCVFAVITASPSATAVTTPFATVATPSLLLVQVTSLCAAFHGLTAAVSVFISSGFITSRAEESRTPLAPVITATVNVINLPLPSFAVALIVAEPSFTPVTRPVCETVATL